MALSLSHNVPLRLSDTQSVIRDLLQTAVASMDHSDSDFNQLAAVRDLTLTHESTRSTHVSTSRPDNTISSRADTSLRVKTSRTPRFRSILLITLTSM